MIELRYAFWMQDTNRFGKINRSVESGPWPRATQPKVSRELRLVALPGEGANTWHKEN